MKKLALFIGPLLLLGTIFLNASIGFADNGLAVSGSGTYNPQNGNIDYTAHWSVTSNFSSLNITAAIPAGTTLVSVGDGGQTTSSGFSWNLGAQASGSSGDVHYSVSVDAAKALNPWAASVIGFSQGSLSSSTPATLQDAQDALGAVDARAFNLGIATSSLSSPGLTVAFDLPAINATGSDITIYSTSPFASALVYASNDLANWVPLGTITGTASLDLGTLPAAKYIRVTASSNSNYAIDAIKMLNVVPLSCGITSHIVATANGTTAATAQADARVDIVPSCGPGSSGSGISGISGISGTSGGLPGSSTSTSSPSGPPSSGGNSSTSTPGGSSTTPPGGGSGSSTPPSSSGSSPTPGSSAPPSSGGGGPSPSISPPGGMGGGGETPPQILGATLPRTGLPINPIMVLIVAELLFIFLEFRNRFIGKQKI